MRAYACLFQLAKQHKLTNMLLVLYFPSSSMCIFKSFLKRVYPISSPSQSTFFFFFLACKTCPPSTNKLGLGGIMNPKKKTKKRMQSEIQISFFWNLKILLQFPFLPLKIKVFRCKYRTFSGHQELLK